MELGNKRKENRIVNKKLEWTENIIATNFKYQEVTPKKPFRLHKLKW